jgi:hypothetical protein
MFKIPFATWIANAAAGLTRVYGDVTRQAEIADWSRQTIYDHRRFSRTPNLPISHPIVFGRPCVFPRF